VVCLAKSNRGPSPTIPDSSLRWKRPSCPLLPRGQHLRAAQPPWSTLRVTQAALGLGGHRACTLPTASGRRVGALLLAGRREIVFSSVSGGGTSSFLGPASGKEAAAFPGASVAGDRPQLDGRSGKPARRLYFPFGVAPQAGPSVGGMRRSRRGKVGHLQRLRGQAALACATNRVPTFYELTPPTWQRSL